MADITASMVKELREMTGAGMMDCKKALTETNGNMDEAVEVLRKKGQAKAEKKALSVCAFIFRRNLATTSGNRAVFTLKPPALQQIPPLLPPGHPRKKEWEKLEKNLGGIKNMKNIPDAIFVVDPKKERICIQEAHTLGIPLIGHLSLT